MKINKIGLILFVGLSLLGKQTWGQKGYLLIDSAYSNGFIETQGKKLNALEVKFRKSSKAPVTTYYPSTATEYGFNDKVYRSRKIATGVDSTAYFLYVLSKGKTSLYIVKIDGRKRFFAENDKEFVELTKENKAYQQQISNLFEKCETYKNYLSDLRFSEKALRRFFTLQNTCYDKGPWPVIRWTGIVGFSSSSLSIKNTYGEEVNMGENGAVLFGVGVEMPIGTRPNWSIMIQSLFQQNSYQTTVEQLTSSELRESKYDIEVSTVAVPLQVKYAIPFNKIKGFVSLGPSLAYNLKNNSHMVENITRFGNTIVNEDSSDLVNKMQVAGAAGLGVEYFINTKISVSLEGRFSTGQGFGTDGHSISSQQILVAVNF